MTASNSVVSIVLIYEPHICASAKLVLQLCCCFNKCKCNCESYNAGVSLARRPGTTKLCVHFSFRVVQRTSMFRGLLIELSLAFSDSNNVFTPQLTQLKRFQRLSALWSRTQARYTVLHHNRHNQDRIYVIAFSPRIQEGGYFSLSCINAESWVWS